LPLKQEKKSAFEIRGEKKYVLINDLCCWDGCFRHIYLLSFLKKQQLIHTHHFLFFLFFWFFFLSYFDECRKSVREKEKKEKSTNLLLLRLLSFPLILSFFQPFSWIAYVTYAFFTVYQVTDWLTFIHQHIYSNI
jgi:hypothetical protein